MFSIRDWPMDERPREKLIHFGPEYLSTAELLAIFFKTGIKGKTALDLARLSLQHFGSLHNLLTANLNDFCALPGLGKTKYAELQAALELNRRFLYEQIRTMDVLNNPRQTREYLLSKLGHQQREIFTCLFLNNQYQVISFAELFQGGINQAEIYLGQIVKAALKHNTSALIVAHNHPSGDLSASAADIELTQELKKALQLVDIKLLDHILVTRNQTLSFAELGFC